MARLARILSLRWTVQEHRIVPWDRVDWRPLEARGASAEQQHEHQKDDEKFWYTEVMHHGESQASFLARFFRSRARFHFASSFSKSTFDTVRTLRKALSIRSASVLPGTFGAGAGFICSAFF
jgi:hypothetical protein